MANAVWMRRNPGPRMVDHDGVALVGTAFSNAAKLEITQNGFRCTGIYHFNRDIFSDIDFLSASMTDVPIEESKFANHFPPNATDIIKLLSSLPEACKKRIASRSRTTQKSEILTSPYKDELVAKSMATKSKQFKEKQNIQSPFNHQGTQCSICGEIFEEN